MLDIGARIVAEETFGGRPDDRAHVIAVDRRHGEEVRGTIPPDRLLVFGPGQGRGPLCALPGIAVPAEPFPHRNAKEDLWKLIGGPACVARLARRLRRR